MGFVLAAAQPDVVGSVGEVGKQAGLSIIESSVLGALLAVSVILNMLLVRKLLSVQDQRVEDKHKDNLQLADVTKTAIESTARATSMMENLERASSNQAQIIQGLKGSVDTVVMQAMRSGGTAASGGT